MLALRDHTFGPDWQVVRSLPGAVVVTAKNFLVMKREKKKKNRKEER